MSDRSALCDLTCQPCQGGIPPLEGDELQQWFRRLGNDWDLIDDHHLRKSFSFGSFAEALAFVNRVGELAEQVNHHPEIHLSFRQVHLELWTHKIDGLADADFIYAAKVDALRE